MREILKDHRNNEGRVLGRVLLITDPHDGTGEGRWFVETQLRFYDQAAAQAAFEIIDTMLDPPAVLDPPA